uniref:ZP domain-containing protein n=1 Tax=Tetraodon nigroviridis TaxID=99883 RepID=H3CGN2_TETNG
MKVEVEKTFPIQLNEDSLHLNQVGGSSCNLTRLSNATHVVAVIPLHACGTQVEEDNKNVIFKNKLTSADQGEVISRHHDVDIAFSCAFPKETKLTLGFRHKNPYAFSERGFGTFTFQFEFYESPLFRQQVNASSYPVDVYLKQMMFMQIESSASIPDTELFVESCKATPYDNPNPPISYTIIENGCVKDTTVQLYPSSRSQFRFGMEAFEFIGAYQEVYISCSVILCVANATGTRCSQGCISGGKHRGRREAVDQTSRHSVSQGPLNLVAPADSKGE